MHLQCLTCFLLDISELNEILYRHHTFPIDLAANCILFSAYSTLKSVITMQIWLNLTRLKNRFILCSTSRSLREIEVGFSE